jgi:hypothetical protein
MGLDTQYGKHLFPPGEAGWLFELCLPGAVHQQNKPPGTPLVLSVAGVGIRLQAGEGKSRSLSRPRAVEIASGMRVGRKSSCN